MTGRPPRPNVDGVRTGAAYREDPLAWCGQCPWTRDDGPGGNWLAIRATARRHTRITGHETRASITYAYAYVADPPAEATP